MLLREFKEGVVGGFLNDSTELESPAGVLVGSLRLVETNAPGPKKAPVEIVFGPFTRAQQPIVVNDLCTLLQNDWSDKWDRVLAYDGKDVVGWSLLVVREAGGKRLQFITDDDGY